METYDILSGYIRGTTEFDRHLYQLWRCGLIEHEELKLELSEITPEMDKLLIFLGE